MPLTTPVSYTHLDVYKRQSETCAFDLLEAEYLREVLPGEMVVVDGDKVVSRPLNNAGKVPVRQCIFELVYFARPDSCLLYTSRCV